MFSTVVCSCAIHSTGASLIHVRSIRVRSSSSKLRRAISRAIAGALRQPTGLWGSDPRQKNHPISPRFQLQYDQWKARCEVNFLAGQHDCFSHRTRHSTSSLGGVPATVSRLRFPVTTITPHVNPRRLPRKAAQASHPSQYRIGNRLSNERSARSTTTLVLRP